MAFTIQKTMLIAFAVFGLTATTALAQNGAVPGDASRRPPMTLSRVSWTHVPNEAPKEFRANDLIKVVVKRRSLALSEGEVDNKKNASGKWALSDWITFSGFGVVPDPQKLGDPTIAGKVDTKYKAEGGVESLNAIEFSITCRVVDIRPNGLLLIEGNDFVQNNDETWSIKFSGTIRADDILPNNTILSENVHEMWIEKNETGPVRDAYRRGWMQKFIDTIQPF